MAAVYILFSKKLDRYYVGSCKDVDFRLNQHVSNVFPKSFTARAKDWELFISIDNLEYAQARQVEQHIKRMKSRVYILNLKLYPELIQKLVSKYSKSPI